MKNLLIGLFIGLAFSAFALAKEKIIVNPMTFINTDKDFIHTTKVTTPEGTYRLFIHENYKGGGGITAVKIN